ncbi:60S ribosomal protein L21, partial [Galemys pyrenaicus]
RNRQWVVSSKNEQHKAEEERAHNVWARSSRKHGAVSLEHTCESTRKAILETSRGWALLKKEHPTHVTMATLKESRQCYPGSSWHCCEQTRKGQDHCQGKKKKKKKEAKEKGSCVQLRYQPAAPREARIVRTNGEEPELLESFPCGF